MMATRAQLALMSRGYYSGTIDGKIGAGTREAIKSFQRDHRLQETGRLDNSTLAALGMSAK